MAGAADQLSNDERFMAALEGFVESRVVLQNTLDLIRDDQTAEYERQATERATHRRRARIWSVVAVVGIACAGAFGWNQYFAGKARDRLLGAVIEQGTRLQSALDPNGCVASRGRAGTFLLILDLKNTVWLATGHPENVLQPTQAQIDASTMVCPGDPGGPPLIDPATGKPIRSPSTTTTTVLVSVPTTTTTTIRDIASAPLEDKVSPPRTTTATTTTMLVPPPNPGQSPVTVPLPGAPNQPPVTVPLPNPDGVLRILVQPLCRLNLLCSPPPSETPS